MATPVNQHKRMAMGEGIGQGEGKASYKSGGKVAKAPVPVEAGKNPNYKKGGKVSVPGMPMSPVTKMRMGNGVPGMKKGGKTKGC